jgi:hypothetical protein
MGPRRSTAGRRRLVVGTLFVLAAIIGAAFGNGSTNSNTVPAGRVGQASTAITTYTITSVAYALDVNNPRYVGQVTFTIAPANPRLVKARFFNAGSWYTCTNAAGSVTCLATAPVVPATSANNLTVVATQ